MENVDQYLEIAQVLFTLICLIAAITPTEKDDKVVDRIKNLINKLKRK